jgi:hypothetical protein
VLKRAHDTSISCPPRETEVVIVKGLRDGRGTSLRESGGRALRAYPRWACGLLAPLVAPECLLSGHRCPAEGGPRSSERAA